MSAVIATLSPPPPPPTKISKKKPRVCSEPAQRPRAAPGHPLVFRSALLSFGISRMVWRGASDRYSY